MATVVRDGTARPLVGRASEMERLELALARTAGGRGDALFLVGEAGIGKSRLAQELLARAQGCGFTAIAGRAHQLEAGVAYAPVVAAFGPFLRRLAGPHLERLVEALPDLGRLFAGLHLPTPQPLGDPALEKTRLFQSLATLLERLSAEAPVLVVMDDLHWADVATLEVLHFLARGLAEMPVLLLATYRAEEIDAARGLRALLNSLHRSGMGEEVVVPRLEPAAVAALAAGVLGAEPPAELLAVLHARAAGTPLFVEALIASLIADGHLDPGTGAWLHRPEAATTPPAGARELFLERLAQLQPPERRVLDLMAVGGAAVAHDTLRGVAGLDDETLLCIVHRLRTTGLLVEEAAGREVDQTRALEVLIAAGQQARALYATDQAVQHFEAALALVRAGHRQDLLPMVLEQLGEGQERIGRGEEAIAAWTEALGHLERVGDAPGMARLHRAIALAEGDLGHFTAAKEHITAGITAMSAHDPSPEMADLLQTQVVILGRLGDHRGVDAAATDLALLAEHLGLPRVLAAAHLAQVSPYAIGRDVTAARGAATRALSYAAAAGEPLLMQRAHDLLALLAYSLGEHEQARSHAQESLEWTRRLGIPTLGLFPRIRLVTADLMAGRWHTAWSASGDALTLARRLGFARGIAGSLSTRALVHLHRGDLDEAAACLAEVRQLFEGGARHDRNIFNVVDMADMMLAMEREDPAGALAVASRFERTPMGGGVLLMVLGLQAEAHVLAGEPDHAWMLAERLRESAPKSSVFAAALAGRVRGLAQSAMGRATDALASLDHAGHAFSSLAMPFEAARTRLQWASVAASGDRAAARASAHASLTAFERLGATVYAKRARRLLHQLGARPRSGPQATDPSGQALSPRETEVVRLVAEDLSTAEMAHRLVISPRTVTTHLSRIYARLGINSRAALVRYAYESGLLPHASPTDGNIT